LNQRPLRPERKEDATEGTQDQGLAEGNAQACTESCTDSAENGNENKLQDIAAMLSELSPDDRAKLAEMLTDEPETA
jgi:hypothetical protein